MNINTFAAFKSRNFRLYFLGQSISLMGTWMQKTAVFWLVYMQTHSTFILGVTAFSMQFPSFLFSLVGGTIADRYNRHNVLILTQIASMIQAAILTLVVMLTDYSVIEMLFLSIILGIINAFDVPARQSLVHFMVDNKEDLSNAIALNSSMVNLAWLIGPAVAGMVLYKLGAGICFMINAISFMAVISSLMMMQLPTYIPRLHTKKVIEELKDGLYYIKSVPSLGLLLLLISLISFFVLPYVTLLPVIAKITLNGNASTYGYLNSFIGIGAFIGSIMLASFKNDVNLKKILMGATTLFGIGLILFSYARNVLWALVFATVTGFGMMLHVTIINSLLQTTSSIEMRGRVISYFAMAFFGMQPLGALFIGGVSHYFGAQHTILLEGILAIIIMLLLRTKFLKNPSL